MNVNPDIIHENPQNSRPAERPLRTILKIASSPFILDACINEWGAGWAIYFYIADQLIEDADAPITDEERSRLVDSRRIVMEEYRLKELAETQWSENVVRRAAVVMNDWSRGQFDTLAYTEEYTLEYLIDLQRIASIAALFGQVFLDSNGRFASKRLLEVLPEYIECARQSRAPRAKLRTTRRVVRHGSPGFVYLLQSPTSAYKIGRASNPHNRLKTFGVQLPFEVEFIALIQTDDMHNLERELHALFDNKRINGEWFALTQQDVEYIRGLAR